MSFIDGNFYPCLILRPSTAIKEGLVVYVFHKNLETEVPSRNLIGNMRCLMHCNVSYTDENGNTGDGFVRAVNCSEDGQPLNFFVCGQKDSKWVALPFLFLTREQAEDFCPGCSLNRLPEVRAFVYDDIPKYENVEWKKISGAPPELIFLNEADEELERYFLSKLNRDECNQLLQSKGFKLKENAKEL
ncbi:unnamed protein product [Callosobruchus maculatus]|uniref:Selenoprotein M n=1 Tax=Callosobruchus maculatus TaxID=64391 RepID=A0A653DJB7_CALMS|nr:unnamed protein product [Callosobruchus maculatus]